MIVVPALAIGLPMWMMNARWSRLRETYDAIEAWKRYPLSWKSAIPLTIVYAAIIYSCWQLIEWWVFLLVK